MELKDKRFNIPLREIFQNILEQTGQPRLTANQRLVILLAITAMEEIFEQQLHQISGGK